MGMRGRSVGAIGAILLIALLVVIWRWSSGLATSAESGPAGVASPSAQVGVVSHVFDGDTVEVTGFGRIRLIGIDAPELGECGHDPARQVMRDLVLRQEVRLIAGGPRDADRYGRLLRYVDVGDVDAGLRLIEAGWAIARYDSRDGYGRHAREREYVAADAASPDRGCWPGRGS